MKTNQTKGIQEDDSRLCLKTPKIQKNLKTPDIFLLVYYHKIFLYLFPY